MPVPDEPTAQPPAEGMPLHPFTAPPNQPRTVLFGDNPDPAMAEAPTQRPPITVTIHDSAGNSFTWPVSPDIPEVYVPGLGVFSIGFRRVLPPVGSVVETGPENDDQPPRRWHRMSEDGWLEEGDRDVLTNADIEAKGALYGWAVVFDATR